MEDSYVLEPVNLGDLRDIMKLSITVLFGALSPPVVIFLPPVSPYFLFLTSALLFIINVSTFGCEHTCSDSEMQRTDLFFMSQSQ